MDQFVNPNGEDSNANQIYHDRAFDVRSTKK
jgi:hypothetical protein